MRELRINTGQTKATYKPWEDFQAVKDFFNGKYLPEENITLNDGVIIADGNAFVKYHIGYAEANNGNKTFRPYLDRLIEYKSILETMPAEAFIKRKLNHRDTDDHSVEASAYVQGPKKRNSLNVFD